MKNQELETLIHQSTRIQKLLFRGIAGVMWFGAVFVGILALVAPTEPGEENAKLFVMGFGVIFVLAGAYCWHLGQKLPQKVIKLINNQPETITEASLYRVQKNGVVAHAVHFKTNDNKKVGVNVANANVANRILQLIQQELPHVTVK